VILGVFAGHSGKLSRLFSAMMSVIRKQKENRKKEDDVVERSYEYPTKIPGESYQARGVMFIQILDQFSNLALKCSPY